MPYDINQVQQQNRINNAHNEYLDSLTPRQRQTAELPLWKKAVRTVLGVALGFSIIGGAVAYNKVLSDRDAVWRENASDIIPSNPDGSLTPQQLEEKEALDQAVAEANPVTSSTTDNGPETS